VREKTLEQFSHLLPVVVHLVASSSDSEPRVSKRCKDALCKYIKDHRAHLLAPPNAARQSRRRDGNESESESSGGNNTESEVESDCTCSGSGSEQSRSSESGSGRAGSNGTRGGGGGGSDDNVSDPGGSSPLAVAMEARRSGPVDSSDDEIGAVLLQQQQIRALLSLYTGSFAFGF
jgi:hypothetical protein